MVKKFVYSHYLQAGLAAAEWADKNLPRGEGGDPEIPVPIGLDDGSTWEYGAAIDSIKLLDPDGLGEIGTLRWHGDGFWVFDPKKQELPNG